MVRINPDKPSNNTETKPSELEDILAAQRKSFNTNPNPDWASRKAKLQTLRDLILGHEAEFVKAISDDFGHRAVEDTLISEFLVIQGGISHAIKHTPKWMKTRKAPTALQYKPAKNVIIPQPLGVIGIISPWNYPLQLAIMPLVGAIGAGNRAMIKPSEYTPRMSQLLKEVLAKGFTDDEVFVATGGVEVASAFSALTFDHLVFTGSTSVGRIVGEAAGKNLVPVTLELGGKSPVIIDESANMKLTVPRIANGKLLNAGQTCVAPDYVIMPEAKINGFADAMIAQAETFYPTVAGNDDYTTIIADAHYARLQDLLEDAENKGAKIRTAGDDDKQQLAKERRVPESISGGVSVNETAWHVVQEDIPFGGVGPSGMGAYHGEAGFRSFSHMKGVFIQSKFSQGKNLFPPYTDKTRKMIGLMKKIL